MPSERDLVFSIRWSAAERAMLLELCEALGLNQSDTMRQLIRQAHELRFGLPKPAKKAKP